MKAFFTAILYQPLYNLFIGLIALIPGHNAGLAIIALTILIRVILIPIRHKSIESQLKQQSLQPEIKRLQEHHKDDKSAFASAQMQLYKEKGINPASGCLPTVVQLLVLVILYRVFLTGLNSGHNDLLYHFVHAPSYIQESFLWIKNLTKPDPYFILPVLAAVAQYLATRSMFAGMPVSNDPNDMAAMISKQMMYVGPISILILATRYPAGLALYWAVASFLDWYIQHTGMRRYHRKAGTAPDMVTVSVRTKKGKS